MPDLEPITRDEKLWSGEDLEPITRREMYIKHLYDETQVIPDKPITREEMFILKAGEELHDVTIEQLNVTENGTYSEAGKAYSPVIVNVPQTTLTTLDVTENGTYTAPSGTAYNEVEVDVPLPENAYLLKDIPATPASIATFPDGSALPMPKLEIAVEPQQSGSGDPSPENIRPISGWSAVDVSVSGVNVWDEEWEQGALSNTTGEPYLISERIRSKNFIPTKPTTAYYFYAPNTYSSIRAACYDKDKTYLGQSRGWINISNNTSFITLDNTYYIKFVVVKADETYDDDISINYPSTDTEYHAYNGQVYTIDLNGTRYGGKLRIINGVAEFVAEKAFVDLGSLSWSVISAQNGVFGATVNGLKTYSYGDTPDMLCSVYKITPSSYNAPYISANGIIWTYVGVSAIRIKDTAYSDATAFKNSLSGQTAVYELATPTIIPLGSVAISSLLGVNNIFADCGNIIDGQYFGKGE